MAEYHKYVFDTEKRLFLGQFESMYRQESISLFDSWHQSDSRYLQRQIDLMIINQYNFNVILDIGCGKGQLTHLLKRKNNRVVGLDISQTAVNTAKSCFPDIEFEVMDVNNIAAMRDFLEFIKQIDLVFCSECFSYLENWRSIVGLLPRYTQYLLVSTFIPDDPIGFIKSRDELETTINNSFDIIEAVQLKCTQSHIVLAHRKQTNNSNNLDGDLI
jgi:SAM-dependent methyltransferase